MPTLSVVLFLKKLLKHSKQAVSAKKKMRLIETYASDIYSWSLEWWIFDPETFPVSSWIT